MSEPVAYNNRTKSGKLKWRPKRWEPEYDRMVAYSTLGRSNTWIAELMKFTPEHVSSILNMPEAFELKRKLQAKMREKMSVDIPAELSKISEVAVRRIKDVINDDVLAEKRPFEMLDRSLDILKGMSHLRGGGNGAPPQQGSVTNIGTVVLAPSQTSSIMDGLKMVAEVKQLHSGPTNDDSDTK